MQDPEDEYRIRRISDKTVKLVKQFGGVIWGEHGKGFRSYLDQGVFLGEHIQVIHLALIPLHMLWPSHLLLEICESLALNSAAIAVFWIARRHTHSTWAM